VPVTSKTATGAYIKHPNMVPTAL